MNQAHTIKTKHKTPTKINTTITLTTTDTNRLCNIAKAEGVSLEKFCARILRAIVNQPNPLIKEEGDGKLKACVTESKSGRSQIILTGASKPLQLSHLEANGLIMAWVLFDHYVTEDRS